MRDHRSLEAWQEARQTVLEVLSLSRMSWRPWAAAMFSQLQRSSLSVQLNLAEGYAYGKCRTTHRLWRVAYGSAVETGDLLELLGDALVIDREACRILTLRNDRVQRLTWGLVRSVQG